MEIQYEIEIKDSNGKLSVKNDSISYLAFVKTLAFAGINSKSNTLQTIFRFLTFIFDFAPSFFDGHFHLHPEIENDPTERNQFSNKIGRTFAIYLAKREYGAKYVYCYECALKQKGHKIAGARPDYYCDTSTTFFSLEAKGSGKGSVSDSVMQTVKKQAQSGVLPKLFSVASNTYNIYNRPRIKFYDPENKIKNYDRDLSVLLRKDYYAGVAKIVESRYFFRTESPEPNFYAYSTILCPDLLKILVHKSIIQNKDLTDEITTYEKESIFIDTDGIGLCIDLKKITQQIKFERKKGVT